MKKIFVLTALTAVAAGANAAVILTSLSYSEDFDGAKLVGATGAFAGTATSPVPGTSGWDGARNGGTGGPMNMVVDNGGANSGAIYSYGATGSTERALGSVASGTNIPSFGVEFVNQTGGTITQITFSFTQENWRSSTSEANTSVFGYKVAAAGQANYLTSTGFTNLASLDLVGPAPVTTNGLLDGNLAINQAARTGTITFNTPVQVGESIYLRWVDSNNVGNDAGLAIDNFTATAVPEPATMAALGLGAAALLRRRNRKS